MTLGRLTIALPAAATALSAGSFAELPPGARIQDYVIVDEPAPPVERPAPRLSWPHRLSEGALMREVWAPGYEVRTARAADTDDCVIYAEWDDGRRVTLQRVSRRDAVVGNINVVWHHHTAQRAHLERVHS